MARTAGDDRSWGLLALLAGAVALQPLGCEVTPGDDGPTGDLPVDAALAQVGVVVFDATTEAATALDALAGVLEARAADDTPSDEGVEDAFLDAMHAWQRVEVMQLGPAGSSLTTLGGEDLRDEIYSWPTVNPCRVDQETVAAAWDEDDFFEARLVNVYGLDALEHLLFVGSLDNACPNQVDINAEGTWDALSDAEIASRRADYAAAVARHAADTAALLAQRWDPSADDFGAQLTATDGAYGSSQEALDAVFEALFYLYDITKDAKVGPPVGVLDCGAEACPEDVEALYLSDSAERVAANLEGFRSLFTGGDGTGLDDLLRELGHDDTADAMLAALDAADAAAVLDLPLEEAVVDAPEDAQALYDAIKAVTDLLKGDVATLLSLQVPVEAAGDND